MIVTTDQTLLRLNIGFIVHQAIGYSRDFSVEVPELLLSADLSVKNLMGHAKVSRTTEGLLVQVEGEAGLDAECVYCLKVIKQPLHLDFVEMYTFPSHADEDTELILADDLHMDLTPLIQEYLLLDIPISPVCMPDCKGLCPICGGNLNLSDCNHDEEAGDPRFSVLKALLDDEGHRPDNFILCARNLA